ncbi:HAD domain-containing protein [Amycolatopsis sp. FBCC-B4732]|uniref:HAD domain-containing protein n=1 Tax=Amycolatopsis sp. FBCC-B4732 TaxID=3079339 RepID=UPI001FF21576|nr:HAD domain-containing protein [Amycolatopsis sp. FBCC-B4732]UOX88140.1 HAD domain-containing protein [Amycolatopsis sp. FBCC-B4732]
MARPLLFLDVDGPLIPFGRRTGDYRTFTDADLGNPLLGRVDPALGPRLLALGCDLVWATTWFEDANECVAPLLGLPPLPVLDFPDEPAAGGRHWKTERIVERAAGSPFVWIDDETTGADRARVANHHPGPALLHTVAADTGLTDGDLAAITAWLASCG